MDSISNLFHFETHFNQFINLLATSDDVNLFYFSEIIIYFCTVLLSEYNW